MTAMNGGAQLNLAGGMSIMITASEGGAELRVCDTGGMALVIVGDNGAEDIDSRGGMICTYYPGGNSASYLGVPVLGNQSALYLSHNIRRTGTDPLLSDGVTLLADAKSGVGYFSDTHGGRVATIDPLAPSGIRVGPLDLGD